MKLQVAALLALPFVGAFAPRSFGRPSSGLHAVVTGAQGTAAKSAEEDLMLTLQIILDHQERSSTVSKDQYVQQMETINAVEEESIDVSIPYDATAQLAYESSDKSMEFDAFKAQYLADAVALVKSKQPIDVSIPYDATAKLAYEASDKSMAYDAFKAQYLADAVALVKSKQPIDVSIPYDATAKLAYEASDKSMAYDAFKTEYLANAVAEVKAKNAPEEEEKDDDVVDVSIPYDATSRLAYEASDKSMEFEAFKAKFLADAVADVIAKQNS